MKFFQTLVTSAFVAVAIAAPAPEAESNIDSLMSELVSRTAEVEGALQARDLEARAPPICDLACRASCAVKGRTGGECRNGTCYCG